MGRASIPEEMVFHSCLWCGYFKPATEYYPRFKSCEEHSINEPGCAACVERRRIKQPRCKPCDNSRVALRRNNKNANVSPLSAREICMNREESRSKLFSSDVVAHSSTSPSHTLSISASSPPSAISPRSSVVTASMSSSCPVS